MGDKKQLESGSDIPAKYEHFFTFLYSEFFPRIWFSNNVKTGSLKLQFGRESSNWHLFHHWKPSPLIELDKQEIAQVQSAIEKTSETIAKINAARAKAKEEKTQYNDDIWLVTLYMHKAWYQLRHWYLVECAMTIESIIKLDVLNKLNAKRVMGKASAMSWWTLARSSFTPIVDVVIGAILMGVAIVAIETIFLLLSPIYYLLIAPVYYLCFKFNIHEIAEAKEAAGNNLYNLVTRGILSPIWRVYKHTLYLPLALVYGAILGYAAVHNARCAHKAFNKQLPNEAVDVGTSTSPISASKRLAKIGDAWKQLSNSMSSNRMMTILWRSEKQISEDSKEHTSEPARIHRSLSV